jgi:hypothetical protein
MVSTAVIASALTAIYVAVQRGIPWALIMQTIADARWLW